MNQGIKKFNYLNSLLFAVNAKLFNSVSFKLEID